MNLVREAINLEQLYLCIILLKMSFIDRISEAIGTKQEQADLDFSMNFRTFLFPNGKDIFTKLKHKVIHEFQQALEVHIRQVTSFLLQQTQKDFPLLDNPQNQINKSQQLEQSSGQNKETASIEQLQQQITTKKDADLAYISKKPSNSHNKVLTQQSASPSQNIENHTQYERKADQMKLSHEASLGQHKSSDKAKNKHKNFNIRPTERSISHQHNKQSQTLQRSQQSYHQNKGRNFKLKPKKAKTNLIKLAPIALEKQKQIKQKEANQKFNAAMDFLNGLHSRRKIVSEHATEWKHEKNEIFAVPKAPSSPLNPTFVRLKELAERYRLEKSSELGQKILERSEVTRKRYRKNQKVQRFVLQKPQPYNLYNINMAKHELFHYRIIS